MTFAFKRYSGVLIFSLLSGCASYVPRTDSCVGDIMQAPDGLVETTDDALLASAIRAPTKGYLCKGKVFVAEKAVTVYRVWDQEHLYTLHGSWWSFASPTGPRDQYRMANDICPEYSALNKMSACTIKLGTRIVIGPGQSAQCANALLPASAVNQVYIANDSRNHVLLVENCDAGVAWPQPVQ